MRFKNFYLAAGAFAALLAALPASAQELVASRTSAELEAYIESIAIQEMERSLDGWGYRPPWRGGPVMMTARAAEGASSSYTTTNVQVAGVDEPDFVKNDARYVHKLVGESLVVADTYPAHKMRELSRTKIEGWPFSLFLFDGVAVVFSTAPPPKGMERPMPGGSGGPEPMIAMRRPWIRPVTPIVKMTTLDLSDRSNPRVARETYIEGDFVNARRVGTEIELVTSARPPGPELAYWTDWSREPTKADIEALKVENRRRIRAATLADWLPRRLDRATQTAPSLAHGASTTYRPVARGGGRNVVTLTALDVASIAAPKHVGILSERGEVYASTTSLYLAVYRWDYWWSYSVGTKPADVSDIHKFSIGGWPRYAGSGQVEGRVLNQFSMDEWEGDLRVATTTEASEQEGRQRANHVFVLCHARPWTRRLEVVGEIRDLAPGERIYSCRFLGERGFVVTFRQVDPLFAIDMRRLEVKGELKIDGFSTYMHPMGENGEYLLTVGNAADPQTGQVTGLLLSIFDVHDLANPARIHYRTIKGAYSQALYEHKAFTFYPPQNALVIPLNDWQNGFSGIEVYDATVASGFRLRGRVDHGDLARQLGWTWGPDVSRTAIVRNSVLLSFSDVGIKANRLSRPKYEYGSLLLKP
ncbi:MAG: beta-propeller domain-containing protein [Planctomycetes bacterium]|nr:beta-propeller domain-containing protein [Planctomycetota bacterium]